jgi:anaerobic ribonucleoside-triphosphate reductase
VGRGLFYYKSDTLSVVKKENYLMKSTDKKISLKDSERTRCEVWTRVMGYFRPVQYFNKGKKSEHSERRYYRIK